MAVKLWAFATFECVKTLRGHDHNVSAVCFLPSGDQVQVSARAMCDNALRVRFKSLTAACGVDQVVSCSRDHSIRIWDCATG